VHYDTNQSEDSVFTAARVFKSVTTYGSFMAANDRPFAAASDERRQSLVKVKSIARPYWMAGKRPCEPCWRR
jgi:hypothetical protein